MRREGMAVEEIISAVRQQERQALLWGRRWEGGTKCQKNKEHSTDERDIPKSPSELNKHAQGLKFQRGCANHADLVVEVNNCQVARSACPAVKQVADAQHHSRGTFTLDLV